MNGGSDLCLFSRRSVLAYARQRITGICRESGKNLNQGIPKLDFGMGFRAVVASFAILDLRNWRNYENLLVFVNNHPSEAGL
jgi:hypothetical protein